MSYIDSQRLTGRTTRMLREAIATAMYGNDVRILANCMSQCLYLKTKAINILESEVYGHNFCVGTNNINYNLNYSPRLLIIGLQNGAKIRFTAFDLYYSSFDYQRFSGILNDNYRGFHEDIFIDHYVFESKFRYLIEAYHRYDTNPED